MTTLAQRFLAALKRERRKDPTRPMILIAHCFGGLVILKVALLDALEDRIKWRDIFESTAGIVFLGTPFRGAEGMNQHELLEAACFGNPEGNMMNSDSWRIYEAGNEFLQDCLHRFTKVSSHITINCFWELKAASSSHGSRNSRIPGGTTSSLTVFGTSVVLMLTKEQHRRLSQPQNSSPPRSADLPRLMRNFVGRDQILDKIHEKLKIGVVVALTGIASIGKSQIARKFCDRFKEDYPESRIFWLKFDTEDSCNNSFCDAGRELGLNGPDESTDVKREVFDWLRKNENSGWLLVLDDADDPELFGKAKDSIPVENGFVLTTSRTMRQVKSPHYDSEEVKVPALEYVDAEKLFDASVGLNLNINEEDLKDLLGLLCHHPLAIVQAAAYLKENRKSAKEYIKVLQRNNRVLAELGAGQPKSLFEALPLEFDRISKENEYSAKLLAQIGYTYPQEIPEALLLTITDEKFFWKGALDTLIAHSLLEEGPKEGTYAMQRLVQATLQKWLNSPQAESCQRDGFERAVVMCADAFPRGDFEQWTNCESVYPHAQAVLSFQESLGNNLTDEAQSQLAILLYKMAWYEWRRGEYDVANKHSEKACKIQRKFPLESRSDYRRSLALRAQILHHHGDYHGAKQLFEDALNQPADQVQQIHEIHEILETKRFLAATLIQLREFNAARTQLEHVLDRLLYRHDGVYDAKCDIAETLRVKDNLAGLLWDQGKADEAKKLFQEALEGQTKVLTKNDPVRLATMVHLAEALYAGYEYEEAENQLWEVLHLYKENLQQQGIESDADTLICLNHLGSVLKFQRKNAQAEEVFSQALDGYKKGVGAVGGNLNEQSIVTMIQLAEVLHIRSAEIAEKKDALADLLKPMYGLATTLEDKGRLRGAETLYRCVLDLGGELAQAREVTRKSWNKMYSLSAKYWAKKRWRDAARLRLVWYKLFISWIASRIPGRGVLQRHWRRTERRP
ncbi:hypothetical protein GQ44DRAFT_825709 [Phaeosphaeriaceae sp. PMI808]|nr:hypothetical protein GQ44DRAFT_825709 [Phaeosphaeriaceae sp. PMI808]